MRATVPLSQYVSVIVFHLLQLTFPADRVRLLACTAHVKVVAVLPKLAVTAELIVFDADLLFLPALGQRTTAAVCVPPLFLPGAVWAAGGCVIKALTSCAPIQSISVLIACPVKYMLGSTLAQDHWGLPAASCQNFWSYTTQLGHLTGLCYYGVVGH